MRWRLSPSSSVTAFELLPFLPQPCLRIQFTVVMPSSYVPLKSSRALVLGFAFGCLSMVGARADEWSAFMPPATEPAHAQPYTDAAIKSVSDEGPFPESFERRFDESARAQLLTLMQQGKWAQAMAVLKAQSPDLNRADDTRLTPLSVAARAGQVEMVRELLRRGAAPDDVGAGGMTPLGAAAFLGNDILIRDLVRAGARVDVPGATGQLPLHLACAAGQTRVLGLLLKLGADWRAPNGAGRHAIEEAALFGQVPVLQFMDERNIDVATPDAHGLNAVHAAALGGQAKALSWLQAKGVPVPSPLTQVLMDRIGSGAAAAH
jgi:hypothetical protein